MSLMQEFKAFALKGNVIELAIGIVIGAAFGKIVSSLVNDIITPAILDPALKAAHLTELSALVIPGTAIKYGSFISEIIAFMIVAFSLFLFVRMVNRTNKKNPPPPPTPLPLTLTEKLLTEIRDAQKLKGL
jgi:large conductance mechanosensitive channel